MQHPCTGDRLDEHVGVIIRNESITEPLFVCLLHSQAGILNKGNCTLDKNAFPRLSFNSIFSDQCILVLHRFTTGCDISRSSKNSEESL